MLFRDKRHFDSLWLEEGGRNMTHKLITLNDVENEWKRRARKRKKETKLCL